ncbi:hypothetical protein K3495_g2835 [Podosphaera aphanis]|nr:hypothetical protein K3495_g2835 [Podosphaera aphanis]
MPVTILNERQVTHLLNNLTKSDVHNFQDSMRIALHEYAAGKTTSNELVDDQPRRTVMNCVNGTTKLFLPASSTHWTGIKVITLNTPSPTSPQVALEASPYKSSGAQGALTLMTAEGSPFAFISSQELTAFRTALTSSLLVSRRTKVKVLTCIGCGKQAYWHIRLTLLLRGNSVKSVHFINRDYSDRAMNLVKEFLSFDLETKKREGWSETSFDYTNIKNGEPEKATKSRIRAADVLFCTTPSIEPLFDHTILTNTEGRKRARLIIAVGSYMPNMIELAPEIIEQAVRSQGANHVFQRRAEEGGAIVVDSVACLREAGELVEASVRADRTIELGELVMLEYVEPEQQVPAGDEYDEEAVATQDNPLLLSPSRSRGGGFRDEGFESCCPQPRSPSRSRKSSVNLARPPPSKRSGSRSRRSSETTSQRGRRSSVSFDSLPLRHRASAIMSMRPKKTAQSEWEIKMSRWLSGGNVVYKSVGMGLMDVVSGVDLVRLAREKGVGTTISDI